MYLNIMQKLLRYFERLLSLSVASFACAVSEYHLGHFHYCFRLWMYDHVFKYHAEITPVFLKGG